MSYWDFPQLEGLWKFAGGDPARAAVMAAIGTAESSGQSGVTSWAGAIGLWQVMPFWAGTFHWPVSNLYQPYYSALAAKYISGDGQHLGAWDTCYNPPSSAAHRLDLRWPEPGSPAYNELQGHGTYSSSAPPPAKPRGPTGADSQLVQQFNWANHLQSNAIPNNTQWVKNNRVLPSPPGGGNLL